MEHRCYVKPDSSMCYLDVLDKLQKWVRGTVGTIVVVSVKPFELKVIGNSQAKYLFRISRLLVTSRTVA